MLFLIIFKIKWLKIKALEAIDYCGHWNGVKLSRHNPPRTFKQVKELELQLKHVKKSYNGAYKIYLNCKRLIVKRRAKWKNYLSKTRLDVKKNPRIALKMFEKEEVI